MSLLIQSIKAISNAFAQYAKGIPFKDDFTGAFIGWIRALFLKEDKNLLQQLEEKPEDSQTARQLEIRLEDMLKKASFQQELAQWMQRLKYQAPGRIDIFEDSNIEERVNIHISEESDKD